MHTAKFNLPVLRSTVIMRTSTTHQSKARHLHSTLIADASRQQVEGNHVKRMSESTYIQDDAQCLGVDPLSSGPRVYAGLKKGRVAKSRKHSLISRGNLACVALVIASGGGGGLAVTCHRGNTHATMRNICLSRISPKFRPKRFKLRYHRLDWSYESGSWCNARIRDCGWDCGLTDTSLR